MERESASNRRPAIPPPIPKRNPNTCLSRTPKLSRPASAPDHETSISRNLSRKPNYYNQSSTLPNRRTHQRLDVCTELLNYISELTQELMAETSFTEVSTAFDHDGVGSGGIRATPPPLPIKPHWPYTRSQSSVAIQTEKDEDEIEFDFARTKGSTHLRRASEGHSIGIQVKAAGSAAKSGGLEHTYSASSNETVVSPAESNRPFKEVRKMLKEGSIEGIEDEPPVFKPPPPPVSTTPPPPLVQLVRPSTNNARPAVHHPHLQSLGPQVRRCLSTFEPSNTANNNRDCGKGGQTPRKKKVFLKTSTNINQLFVEPMVAVSKENQNTVELESSSSSASGRRTHKHAKTSNFASKSATVDRCIRHSLSPAALEKQRHGGTRTPPPPPPTCKEPPPKIVVEMAAPPPQSSNDPVDDKHKENSTCGSTCSCLCLKRQSPCSSPIPSKGSSLLSISPPLSSPVTTTKSLRGNVDVQPIVQQKLSPDAPAVIQQEAYNALVAEIRAAIKQRQIGPKKTDDTYTQ